MTKKKAPAPVGRPVPLTPPPEGAHPPAQPMHQRREKLSRDDGLVIRKPGEPALIRIPPPKK